MLRKLIFLFLIPFLVACGKKDVQKTTKPTVLVSIAPYAYFAERIGGETIQVKTLVPPGVNLHIYEPAIRGVQACSNALVWFQIGEPFEKKIGRVFSEKNPDQKIVNLQEGIQLLEADDAIELTPCEEGHFHGAEDLHTWLSPSNVVIQSKKIRDTLIALMPQNKTLYEKNYELLREDLEKLDQLLTDQLLPYKGGAILLSHPALAYFCRDYGLIQLSVECEGKEPKPRDLEKILHLTNEYRVRCVFLQKGFNNKGASIIGKKLNLPIYCIDPYAKDYLKNMQKIAGYIE